MVEDFFKTFAGASKRDRDTIAEALHGVSIPIDGTAAGVCIRCNTQDPELDDSDHCATCGAPVIPSDLRIPRWLVMPNDQRRAAWEGRPTTDYRGGNVEEWKKREAERRALIAEQEKAKKAKSLARLKEQHAGERYDRKAKAWVKVERQ